MFLSSVFQHENIGFLATLPLVIAASVNFSMLVLAMYWRGLTTRGAVAGGLTGLVLSVGLLLLSKKVWVDVLGNAQGVFPFEYPTVFSLGAAFLVAVLVSLTDRSAGGQREREAFDRQLLVSERGPSGCMVTLSSVGSEGHSELGELVRSARAITLDRLKARLGQAVTDGEIPTSVDVHALARFVQTVQNGMSILARDGASRAELEAVAQVAMQGWDARTSIATGPAQEA
jgi:hypothetical protein